MNFSRRNLLRMMGLAGAGVVLPSLLDGPRIAGAAPSGIPRRVLFFYTEQGSLRFYRNEVLTNFWTPIAPGAPAATSLTTPWSTTTHTLGELHQPLAAYKNRLLFLDGLDMRSAHVDPVGPANAHIHGNTHAMTSANRQTSSIAGGISIDQFIARGLNNPTPVTRVPSLELYVSADGGDGNGEALPLYASPGQPLPISGSTMTAYDRLFPNGPTGTSPEEQAKLAAMIARQQAVLDYARDDFSALGSRLGRADRERLSAHAAAVSDLSKSIAVGARACVEPERGITNGTNTYQKRADVMMRLAQTAFACDLTRVVTLYLTQPPDDLIGYTSVGGTADFHDMVHKTNGWGPNTQGPELAGNPAAMQIVKNCHIYYAQQFERLLALLDAIPEADGGTMLDHTLVLWCGQLGAGDHSLDMLPYILAGRGGGTVTSGRYVRYPRVPDPEWWPIYSRGPAHSDLFVWLANAMGVATNSFGNAAVCKGPLAGIA